MPVGTDTLQKWSNKNFGLDFPAGLRLATGIDLDPNGIAQQLYDSDLYGASDNFVTLLGGRQLSLPGTSGSYVSTPDHASLDIAGDIDIRFEGQTFADGNRAMVNKWGASPQQSYLYRMGAFSLHAFSYSTTGSNAIGTNSDLAQTAINGAVRVAMDADDGAGNRVVTFYSGSKSSQDSEITGATSVVSVETVAAVATIFNSTAPLIVGGTVNGTGNLARLFVDRIEVRNGIDGTIVANPDFRFMSPGDTTVVDSTGKTWTLNGNAVIV